MATMVALRRHFVGCTMTAVSPRAKRKEALQTMNADGAKWFIKLREVRASRPNIRFMVLLVIASSLFVLFFGLLHVTPEGQRWLALWQSRKARLLHRLRLRYALYRDPPLGSPMQGFIPLTDSSSNSSLKPVLIIVLGKCEGCNQKTVMEWSDVLGKWQTLKREITGVLVIQDTSNRLAQLGAKLPSDVTIVTDEDGQISRKLNAVFVPRAYGFEHGRLIWLQETPNAGIVKILESFLTRVKGAERAKSIINAWSMEMREEAWKKLRSPNRMKER